MAIFSFLEGMSPWWWVSFGIGLLAIEMLVMSFFLIWPGLAALAMAGILYLNPAMQGEIQVSLFAIISILLTFAGRYFFQRHEPETSLNQRTKQIIGMKARVTDFELGTGHVEINGLRWVAKWPEGQTAKPGDIVTITAAEGMTVEVSNI